MAMNIRRNPLAALLDYAANRGDEASSIGSVMSQLASPILKSQGVQPESAVQRGPVPQPTLVSTAPEAPVAPLPKTTSDTEEYYIREYQKRGFSRHVAEGMVAGQSSESGLNPAINERNPVVAGSRGGFGLDQLTGPRRIAFERWAAENNKNINDPNAQMDFRMVEFAGPEREAYDALIAAPDAQSAAAIYTDQFLRPGISHTAQSANQAARMSGQAYDPALGGAGINTSVSTMSAPQTGGGMPQTVEGILSTLYPDGNADEKTARRKDVLMGLSQGLSALSQGRPVDLSNIAANADQRRRQNVVDMRERERARAGASLIYSQTGDSDMAAAVAAGTMSINDVFSKRERDRVEKQADAQRLKVEQANGSLADLIGRQSAADLGLSEDAHASAIEAIRGGADINTVLSVGNIAKVAEASRKAEDEAAAAAEQRLAAIERMKQHPDQVFRTAASLMELDPKMLLADAIKSATPAAGASTPDQIQIAQQMVADGVHPTVGAALAALNAKAGASTPDQIQIAQQMVADGVHPTVGAALAALNAKAGDTLKPTGNMQDAQALVDSKAINAATGKEYTIAEAMAATILTPPAPPGFRYVIGPNNTPMLVQDTAQSTGTPTAAGGAPTAAGGTPATPTVGNAFSSTYGSASEAAKAALLPGDMAQQAATLDQTITETAATKQETAAKAATAPVDLAAKQTDLDLKQQDLAARRAVAPDAIAKSALDVEAATLANQQAALNLQIAQADQSVDAATKAANLELAQQQVRTAQQTYDTAVATANQAKADAQKLSTSSYINADKQFAVFEDSAKEVMAHGLDAMTTGILGQVVDKFGQYVVDQTPRSDFLAKVGTMGSQLMLDALSQLKAAGVALTPVTDTDLKVAGAAASLLSDPSKLSGETIVKETAFQTNYMKDVLYGPKDLTRYDEFGQPYKVGQSTLGVTEDTFARHWLSIPPAVKDAWRTGKITTLPIDDPNYAEAAKVVNAMENNFRLYQPDVPIDRTLVGIPVPEGVEPELWPDIWAGLSADSKAELTKAAK